LKVPVSLLHHFCIISSPLRQAESGLSEEAAYIPTQPLIQLYGLLIILIQELFQSSPELLASATDHQLSFDSPDAEELDAAVQSTEGIEVGDRHSQH
jgi:hypothetical protein